MNILEFNKKTSKTPELSTSASINQDGSQELAEESSTASEAMAQSKTNTKSRHKSHHKERPLIAFWIESFVSITILIVISTILILILDQQQNQMVTTQILETRVDAIAERLSQTLNFYQNLLKGLALDPNLISLANNKTAIKTTLAQEQTLTKIIPGALRVRLLQAGYEIPDVETEPPLSYASMAMLRAAEESKQLLPLEVHQSKGKQLYLVGAVALRDNAGQVQGLLHVMWNATLLFNEIKKFSSDNGQIALQQQVNEQPVTIFGAHILESPDGIRPLVASQMRIIYWQNHSISIPLLMPIIWIISGLIFAFSLVLGIQYWRLSQAITADQTLILGVLEDVLAGRKSKLVTVSIRELSGTIQALLKITKTSKGVTVDRRTPNQLTGTMQKPDLTVALVTEVAEKTKAAMPQNTSDIAIEASQKTLLPTVAPQENSMPQAAPADVDIPKTLFCKHDIRGIFEQGLTTEIAYELGRAIGSKLQELNQKTLNVARDAKPSGVELSAALIEGLIATGRDVMDLGVTTAPIAYFSTHHLDRGACVFVSVGRAPPEYNGFKILINNEMVVESNLLALRQLALEGPLYQGIGSRHEQDLLPAYIDRIAEDISIARPLKVVIDCGSGCTSLVAPQLFRTLGCEVVELLCELDASFPGHPPDPSRPENLKLLQTTVVSETADLGLAFDAEGDRIGIVDSKGRIIWPDRLLMVLAADVLARNPGGDIVLDVNCSRALVNQILQSGGRPIMWQAGHAALKAKLRDTQALLAGDWSGHIIFQERWYGFDDACYAAARLMEILSVDPRTTAEFFNDFPNYTSTPEFSLKMQEGENQILIKLLQEQGTLLKGARLVTIDGLRAEYEDGWGLVRAANTGPFLRFRFETDDETVLERIQTAYRDLLAKVAPKLKLPF